MIRVEMPDSRRPERRYVVGVILGEMLGLDFQLGFSGRHDTLVAVDGAAGEVAIDDVFLKAGEAEWFGRGTLPRLPCPRWRIPAEISVPGHVPRELAVLYAGPAGPRFEQSAGRAELGVDIFGAAFFMLSRYEECVGGLLDEHERFPAAESVAGKEGLLHRPVVNEYVELLWAVLRASWPRLVRRPRQFRVLLSHDVDHPLSAAFLTARELARTTAGDVLRRGSLGLAARRLLAAVQAPYARYDHDPFNTFDFLMSVSESNGLSSAFYFIAGRTDPRRDGRYRMDMPWIRALMRRIADRGHEIGLHPSYRTFKDPAQLKIEFGTLLESAAAVGITQAHWGGRQHYLRWSARETWRHWASAGLAYDSSVGYAEVPGFRAGTCYEYTAFDLAARQHLPLRERPLLLMDSTLLARNYMNLSLPDALIAARAVADTCRAYAGDFALLWHNSALVTPAQRAAYSEFLDLLSR
jgi:hypothetical protein